MTWREFIQSNLDTLGVTLVFSALGSGISLWATDVTNPVTRGRALFVIATGQLVNFCVTVYLLGVLQWSQFIAPGVGALCGILGVAIIGLVMSRGSDIANTLVNMVLRKREGDSK